MTWRMTATAAAPADWEACEQRCQGSLFHSVHWGEAHASAFSRPVYVRWTDPDGECMAIAVGVERRSPTAGVGRLFRRLDFESYPAVASGTRHDARVAIADLLHYAASEGYRALAIQSYATPITDLDMAAIGLTPVPRLEFVVDLTLPADAALKRLSTHHRRKIKRAGANGLTFAESVSLDALRQSRALQVRSRDRRVARGEWIPSGDDAAFELLGTRLFASNVGRVWLASRGDEIVSAAFVWIYRDTGFYAYGGSSDAGFELDAPAWLFWQGFEHCRRLGCARFNLGGVSVAAKSPEAQSHGLYRFKQAFGGEERSCISGHAEELTSKLEAAVSGVKGFWRR